MTIGNRVKGLRKTRGLTQDALAQLAGITQSSLSEIERGQTKYGSGPVLIRLAAALRVSPNWLSTGRGSPTEAPRSDPDSSEALHIYQALSPALRDAWMASGRALLAQSGPSLANPYHPAKAKS